MEVDRAMVDKAMEENNQLKCKNLSNSRMSLGQETVTTNSQEEETVKGTPINNKTMLMVNKNKIDLINNTIIQSTEVEDNKKDRLLDNHINTTHTKRGQQMSQLLGKDVRLEIIVGQQLRNLQLNYTHLLVEKVAFNYSDEMKIDSYNNS
jgi:hypothetical protein